MNLNIYQNKLLSQILIFGLIATGLPLLSTKAVRAANILFNFNMEASGTAPFDANNDAGNDENATNNIVRTQDIITYKWQYNISNGAANNAILRATVPNNVELALPAACITGSQITNDVATGSQSIECKLGNLSPGSSGSIDLKGRVLSKKRSLSNTFVGNGNVTNAIGSMSADNVTNTINSITTSNLTISAAPKADLFKQAAYVEGAAKGEDGVTDGLVIRYPIVIALTGGGKGGEALQGNIQFTDTLVYNGGSNDGQPIPGAKLYTWRPSYSSYSSLTSGSNSSCNRMGGDPWAYYGGYPNGKINSSYYPAYGNPESSTTDSGTWTCSQASAGQPIQFNISGADTTGDRAPTKDYYGGSTLPADQTYLAVGALHIWVPASVVTANGGQLNVRNKVSAFTAQGASGQTNQEPTLANNNYDHTLVSTSGSFTSHYATDVDNRGTPLPGMSAIYGGDGPVMPNQTYTDRVYINNNGALPWGVGSILCTAIDNQTQAVRPLAGTPASAVRNFSYYGTLGIDYVIEYGTGNYVTVLDHKKATCRDIDSPGGWFSDIRNVPGGADAVTKVRVRAIKPILAGHTWDIAVNLKARNTYLGTTNQIPIGTKLVQHSSFYIPGYPNPGQGEPGMPTDWYGGYYQRDINYYIGWGDRLTMTRAIVRIDKQNVPNNPTINAVAGSEVTFILKSSITAGVNPPPVNPNVTIRDILPATMNYVVGSASIAPTSIITNPDSTKTIIWDLGPRTPNQVVPDITYRASIRPDTPNNATVVNTAIIESPDDATLEQYRTDIASVTVGNASSFRIFKEVEQSIINRNNDITYYLYYANTGSSDVGTSQFIDVLPNLNDGRTPATVYAGSSSFSSIAGTNGETFEFTNRPHSQINPDPNDASNLTGGSTIWCLSTAFGTTGCPTANSNVTGIRINAPAFSKNLPTRKLTLNITTTGNNPDDRYTNRFTGRTNGLLGLLVSNDVFTRVRFPPNVLLVKRITAINNKLFSTVVNDPNTSNDNHPNWPANYLLGAINAGKVKPGDEIQYTIYFMNAGEDNANNLKLCDRLMPNQLFQTNKYAGGMGIQFKLGADPSLNLTNAADSVDRAQFLPADKAMPTTCNIPNGAKNDNGTIVLDVTGNAGTGSPNLTTLPASTSSGFPTNSYGLIRFTTKVQ
jgi:uncharacterized repeat protein (TIGR01451 family)